MKRFFPVLFLLLFASLSSAQFTTLFTATGVQVTPPNPTPNDSVFITISGFRLDSCAYLDTLIYSVDLNVVNMNMSWFEDPDAFPGTQCGIQANIPFDTTINLGLLLPGVYTTNVFGGSLLDDIPAGQGVFTVATVECYNPVNGDIWVTSAFDNGAGTLRAAIDCANMITGPNTIKFNIPSLTQTKILVGLASQAPLPAITDPGTIIDGTTQPGWGATGNSEPLIEISGLVSNGNAPDGLTVQATNTEIYGVRITDFDEHGLVVESVSNVIIGGAGQGNAFFSNGGAGIFMTNGASNCQISGNWIGTDHTLANNFGNGVAGVLGLNGGVNSSVGLSSPGTGNIIYQNPVGVIVDGVGGFAISQNDFRCNDVGIALKNNGNLNQQAPTIGLATINGISGDNLIPGTVVEVFINEAVDCQSAGCQGAIYLGTTTASTVGWTLTPPYANGVTLVGGERVTASARFGSNQSPFSDCAVVRGVSTCTDNEGTIEVTNTNDEGAGSLRDAMECANSTLGGNAVYINIPGNGPHIISVGLTSSLPLPSLIDAGTVIHTNGSEVILDGGNTSWNVPADGLTIETDLIEVYGLTIRNFADDGISISGGNGNKIGSAIMGNFIYGNGDAQDVWPGISGGPFDGSGIHLSAGSNRNTIYNNIIGTNSGATLDAGNEFCGIFIEGNSNNNEIGSESAGTGNIINNNEVGIQISSGIENQMRSLSLACNSVQGIMLVAGSNNDLEAPTITEARTDSIFGTTTIQEGTVELYLLDNTNCSSAPCQGKTLLASQSIDNGEWLFMPPYNGGASPTMGELITLVFTDEDGNSSDYTTCASLEVPCFLQLNISNITHTSCGLDNGSFTLEATNGTGPYFYDIGNGQGLSGTFNNLAANFYLVEATDAFGCTVDEIININGSQSIVASLVSNISATCNLANGALEFIGTNGTAPYSYSLDNGAPQGSGIFANLAAGTYQVEITDDEGCMATSTAIVGNTGIDPVASFSVSLNFDTLTITDQSALADNYIYTFGDGNSSNLSDPVHVFGQSGVFLVCQTVSNSCGANSICETITVTVAPSEFNIDGAIYREDGSPINNAELTCVSTDISDVNGDYLIEDVPDGTNCSIEPTKTDSPTSGVTVTDIVLLQRHIILLDTLDSPYKIIAGDVNGSGDITVSDLVNMQRVILLFDPIFGINKTWRFIPEEYNFPNPLRPLDFNFPESIFFNGVATDIVDQDFIGLKVGDLDNSASTLNIQQDDPISFLIAPTIRGNVMTLECRIKDAKQLNGFQGKFNFDHQFLTFNDLTSQTQNLKTNLTNEGFSFLWFDELGKKEGKYFEKNELLFAIQFEIKGDGEKSLSELLELQKSNSLTFDFAHGEQFIQLDIENELTISKSDQVSFYPNPFSHQLLIKNDDSLEKSFDWELVNVNGNTILSGYHAIGEDRLKGNLETIPDGIYFLKTRIKGNSQVRRILKLTE